MNAANTWRRRGRRTKFMVWLSALGATVAVAAPSSAQTTKYAPSHRQIRAAVLTFAGYNNRNVTPFVWYAMERREESKPPGWEFLNPLAPATVTGEIYQRWSARGRVSDPAFRNGTPENLAFRVGAQMTKNMAPYWEVDVEKISDDDLKQLDVAIISLRGATVGFSAEVRERLRRFVDGGGTLWLEAEDSGVSIAPNAPFTLPVTFGGAVIPVGTRAVIGAQRHPLVSYPFPISQIDVRNVGTYAPSHIGHVASMAFGLQSPFYTVLWAGRPAAGRAYLSAADYGAGHIVISSAGIATGVAGALGGANVDGPNSGVMSGDNFQQVQPTDLKIAFNIVSYSSSAPTAAANSRRTGATSDVVGTGLGVKWSTVPPASGAGAYSSGAVISKGIAYYVHSEGGNTFLRAYDLNPNADLDFDGNPDDGIVDFAYDSPYDLLWEASLPSGLRFSTPTIVAGTGAARSSDLVCITGSDGITRAYNGLPINAQGRIQTAGALLWTSPGGTHDLYASLPFGLFGTIPTPAPAYSEGILFTIGYDASNSTDPNEGWRIVPLNVQRGRNVFGAAGASGNVPVLPPTALTVGAPQNDGAGLPSPVSALSVGYVQDPGTGALDKVVYFSTRPRASVNNPVVQEQGSIFGAWFSTKGEPLVSDAAGTGWQPMAARRQFFWNANAGAIPEILPVIHIIHRNAVTGLIVGQENYDYASGFFQVTYQTVGSTPGMLVTLSSARASTATDKYEIFADYTLDWTGDPVGAISPSTTNIRSFLREIPLGTQLVSADTSPLTLAKSAIAISGHDTLIFNQTFTLTGSATPPPSRIYSFRDGIVAQATGSRSSRSSGNVAGVAWMFAPYSSQEAGGIPDFPIAARMTYSGDGLKPAAGNEELSQFQAVGSPVVQNGVVYVVGTANSTGNPNRVTVILALRENPTLSFTLNSGPIPQGAAVVIEQPNLLASTPATSQFLALNKDDYAVDEASGTITLLNMRSTIGNSNLNALNTSLPLRVRIQVGSTLGSPELVIDRRTGLSKLDNLLWYMVLPQSLLFNAATTPAMQARQDAFIKTETEGNAAYGATLAMNGVNVPTSGPTVSGSTLFFGTLDGRIASVDLSGISGSGGFESLFNGEQLRLQLVRTLTNPLTGFPLAQPVTEAPQASSDSIAVGTPLGMATLDNRLTLIADANRLLEVNYGGAAVTSISATRSANAINGGTGPFVTSRVGLARPSVARISRQGDYMIADTGNNRVIRTDRSGYISSELRNFSDDFRVAGGTNSLLAPSDVQSYEEGSRDPGAVFTVRNPLTNQVFQYTGPYFATRYIVADTGNFRIVEIVDAYDENGDPLIVTASNGDQVTMQRQAVWSTATLSSQNSRLRYRSVQQFSNATLNGELDLIASVDNLSASAVDINSSAFGANGIADPAPGGSLIAFHRYRNDETPVAPAKDGDIKVVINSLVYGTPGAMNPAQRVTKRQPILNPSFFRTFSVRGAGNTVESRYLLCDENGAYVLRPVGGEAYIEWALTSEDYFRLTGRKLRAASIQKLPQSDYDPGTNKFYPHYLITNQYTGSDNLKQFYTLNSGVAAANQVNDSETRGEVFEIKGIDYYLDQNGDGQIDRYQSVNSFRYNVDVANRPQINVLGAIVWSIPTETMVNNGGIFSITRKIGSESNATFTFNLEQPAYSERQN